MRLALAVSLVLGLSGNGFAQKPAPVENVSTFDPRTPAQEQKALHVPPGFEVQLVAADPDIHKPLNIAFDDKGRLWVTDTVEYPYPAPEGKTPRDTVKVLEDFGPDGRARKVTTFADGLNIPIGVLPLPDGKSALVHSIPDIYRLTDTDGDGKADRREPLYQSIGFKDTHGMTNSFTWGFDGWIYACHGFSNESTLQGADKKPIVMQSGNVYRFRPDGTHAEIFSHGQVNPFGLAFDPLGNLYSSDCHSRPIYQNLRGAYYPSFGKPDDGLGFGPDMMTHDHGSTAIDGVIFYAADNFSETYRGTMFVGNVVTNRINHDRLEWHGSTPKAIPQDDFLWSEDNWFRPVDMEIGPDGALYVADFYNRIIGHYEVPLTHPGRDRERGRIWRIVYRGPDGKIEAKAPRADWSKATLPELIEDLGHPNLVVRIKAANTLVARGGPEVVAAVENAETATKNPEQRVHSLWVLHRLHSLRDETLFRETGVIGEGGVCVAPPAREEPQADASRVFGRVVRTHALRILAERPVLGDNLSALPRALLEDVDPFVLRAAAEATGRHPQNRDILPLLAVRQSLPADDTHLIHVVRMSLRDHLLEESAWTYLEGKTLTDRDASDIADVSNGVPTPQAAKSLLKHIQTRKESHENLVRHVHHIARYGAEETGPALLAFINDRRKEGLNAPFDLVNAVQQGTRERGARPSEALHALALELTRGLLDSKRPDEVQRGISLASSFPLPETRDRLQTLAGNSQAPEPQRLESLSALVTLGPGATVKLLGEVLGTPSEPVPVRERAATLLGGIDQAEARVELLKVLPAAPERLQTTIAAGLAGRKPGAEALLESVKAGKASARLLQESRVANPLQNAGVPDLKDRLAALLKGLPPADQKINQLMHRRRAAFTQNPGDPGRGAQVFEKSCAACHQIGGKGSRIGPQLDGVGLRGADRLVEDILDPSRNVDQAFRATNLALKNGQVVSGLLLKEEGEVLVLADAQGKEVRVPKDSVEERGTTQLSPMPANFDEQVKEGDFADLIAFLIARRSK